MSSILRAYLWLNLAPCFLCKWISSTSTLPIADYGFAVGSYDRKIYILGGYANSHKVTEYHLDSDTIIDNEHNTLPISISSSSQFWTQRQDTLYMISSSTSTIASFDMMSQTFSPSFKPDANHVINSYGCLTSSSDCLFLLGGYDASTSLHMDSLQVFDFTSDTWAKSASSMTTARMYPMCTVNNHYLWALGGRHSTDYITSTERISITNIVESEWNDDTPLLAQPSLYARAVSYRHYIYVIGGSHGENMLDTVQIIDTLHKTMTVSSDTLPYGVDSAGSVFYDGYLYLFGGRTALHPIVSVNTLLYKHIINTSEKRSVSFVSLEARAAGDAAINSSVAPTKKPTEPPKSDGNNDTNSGGLFGNVDDTILILTAVCLALLVILLSLLLGFVCWKRKRDEKLNKELEEQYLHNIASELHQKEMVENAMKAASADDEQMDEDEVLQQVLALSAFEQKQQKEAYQQVDDEATANKKDRLGSDDSAANAEEVPVDKGDADKGHQDDNDSDKLDEHDDDEKDDDMVIDGAETSMGMGIVDDYKQDVEDAMDRPDAASAQADNAVIDMLVGDGDHPFNNAMDVVDENTGNGNSDDSDDDVIIGVETALPTTSGAGE